MQTTSLLKLVALVSALALSACGGGSASLSTAPASPGTGPGSGSTATPADLQLAVPAPTYGANSQELKVFQAVNDFRASLHLGLWTQNASLDTSAKNHTSYSLLAGSLGHTEDPAARGFTGVAPLDRDRLAGYAGSIVTELGAALVANTGVADADAGVALVTSLKNSVYHGAALMDQGFREMGAAVLSDGTFIDLFIEIGFQTKPQSNASDFTLFYPLNGQTGVRLASSAESPNPWPDLAAADYFTKTTSPLTFQSAAGTTLTVNAFTVTEAGSSTALDARLMTQATDPNHLLGAHIAYLVGKAKFKPNTSYTANFSGAVNGVAITRTWSFTTGAV